MAFAILVYCGSFESYNCWLLTLGKKIKKMVYCITHCELKWQSIGQFWDSLYYFNHTVKYNDYLYVLFQILVYNMTFLELLTVYNNIV